MAIRNRKRLFRGLILAGVCLTLWIVGIGPWWHGWFNIPAEEKEYASACLAEFQRYAARRAEMQTAPGRLFAGAASVPIDCPRHVPLAGYGRRALLEGNDGPADPIAAKAVVLQDSNIRIALVSADLLLINRQLAQMVLEHLRLSSPNPWTREQLYFGATHTHSGPGGFPHSFTESVGLGTYDPQMAQTLSQTLAQAVLEAERQLVEVRFSAQSKQVEPRAIRNRTMAEDATNRWLDVLSFYPAKDGVDLEPVATVAVFSAHATCRSSRDMKVSADYPGVLCRYVEEQLGGVCLFFAGGVGSMGPPNDVVPREELDRWLGTYLGEEVCQLATAQSSDGSPEQVPSLDVAGLWLPLPQPKIKLSEHWRLSPILGSVLLPNRVWIHAVRIGDQVLIGAPADYSGILTEQLRQHLAGCTTIVTSFNGDYVGYILPDSYYPLGEYETGLCFFGPSMGTLTQQNLQWLALLVRQSK